MNIVNLAASISSVIEVSESACSAMIVATCREIVGALNRGETVKIAGLGVFSARVWGRRGVVGVRGRVLVSVSDVSRVGFVASSYVDKWINGELVPNSLVRPGETDLSIDALLRIAAAGGAGCVGDDVINGRAEWFCDCGGGWVCDGSVDSWGWRCADGSAPKLRLANKYVDLFLAVMANEIRICLYGGGNVRMRGFGTMFVGRRPARSGVVPLAGGGMSEPKSFPARKYIGVILFL